MRRRNTGSGASFFLALMIVILGALILVDVLDIWDVFNLLKLREIFND